MAQRARRALAPHVTVQARAQALDQELAAALAIGHEFWRARALAALAAHLTGEALEEGLAAAHPAPDRRQSPTQEPLRRQT